MKLTIGMATFDDYDGVYFTIQALRMYHPEVMADTELIVVDNKPDSKASPMIKSLLETWVKGTAGARYIPMSSPQGTTAPRQRIFDEAQGEIVLCMDSHVFIVPGALTRLIDYYQLDREPHYRTHQGMDLYSGPILYDDLKSISTHFDNVWRAQMWGIWGEAWTSNDPTQPPFTVLQAKDGYCTYHRLDMSLEQIPGPTNLPYANRSHLLLNLGYQQLGWQDQPFEIPAMGLGLFACRKDAWLGFNPHFQGFGGEEMYIHEKFRKAGRKAICLPWLKWGHRFGRPEGTKYVPLLFNKVRNYVLGHLELGLSLDLVHKHFVPTFPPAMWDWLLVDPVNRDLKALPQPPAGYVPSPEKLAKLTGQPQPRATADLNEIIDFLKSTPRDLDKHLDTLAALAEQCDQVVEISHRRESTAALLKSKHLKSFNAEIDPLLPRLVDLHPNRIDLHHYELNAVPFLPTIPETDLLFLDTYHTADRIYKELSNYHKQVRRWIVLHDTQLYRETGEGHTKEKPVAGLLVGLRQFMKQHPEWSVVEHNKEQYGLTILSKLEIDKPKLPPTTQMAANLATSLATYVADGMRQVSKEQLTARLDICNTCTQRTNDRCAVCGCHLSAKATMRSMACPLGYWPSVAPPPISSPEKQGTEQMAS